MSYFLYLLRCADGTFYCGVTNDLEKRLYAHNFLKSGAKYTRSRRPAALAYSKRFRTKGAALKAEWKIKKLSREEKMKLVSVSRSARLRDAKE